MAHETSLHTDHDRDHAADLHPRRQEAMAVLAESSSAEIERLLAACGPLPAHQEIRKAENGLVMVRGRIGGDGAPFNFGEATVSRCAVRLATDEVGFGYVLGRDHAKARLIACCDALMQRDEHRDSIERIVLGPIRRRVRAEQQLKREQAAATKVEFYTLVRGED
jgi:alpha-D-ribose 1-methylphosphonate 5-triphosphate synthase subunit PhnG